MKKKFCVYTSLVGNYEKLNEQNPEFARDVDFLCFTDDANMRSSTWKIVKSDMIFPEDSIRSQRYFKMKPEAYLRDYSNSIYIDNSIRLTAHPEELFQLFNQDRGMMIAPHSFRDTVLDEFEKVFEFSLDDQMRIFEQLNYYANYSPHILEEKPFWGGLIIRSHDDGDISRFNDFWFAHVCRYTRRDQLSLNYCLDILSIRPQILHIDNHKSDYHTWPHHFGRDRAKTVRKSLHAIMPPLLNVAQLKANIRELREKLEERFRFDGGDIDGLCGVTEQVDEELRVISPEAAPQSFKVAAAAAKELKMPESGPWIRYVMDRETRRLVEQSNPSSLDVFEVSGSAWRDVYKWKSYTSREFPDFDVCKDPFECQYDLIIAEQVFEHVRFPWSAAKNMFEGLRAGGHVLITTPFMFHIHPTPLDCWRWTPQGMGFMLEDAGFSAENIVTGGWGNYECFLRHAIDQSSAPAYNESFSINNVPHIPQVVWGFAKK